MYIVAPLLCFRMREVYRPFLGEASPSDLAV